MSAFYDQASLVVVPSGYKSGKIYAQKPLTTDGQLTFTRASTATRVNASGLIETVSSGVPRLDYQGSTCPKLLLEPQRTNLFTYSEQLDNAAWVKNVTTITANAIVAPDGTTTADKMADSDTTTAARYTFQSPASSGTIYTSSGYFKKGEYNFVTLHAFGINGAVFNLDTGVKVSQSGGVGSIVSVGNGWYRCSFVFTAGGSSVFFSQSPAGNISYAGTTGSGIYAWGLQVETGAYATSYIPTTSAAVTRLADMSGTTNYFGAQTFAGDFTFFVDLLPMEGNTGISDAMILGGGDYNGGGNFQSYFRFASGNIILRGVAEALIISRSYTMNANQQYKILVTRTGTTVKIFANGAQVGASATSSTSVILRSLGWSYIQASYNYDGRINQVLLMPSGLTDAQAIELTTL